MGPSLYLTLGLLALGGLHGSWSAWREKSAYERLLPLILAGMEVGFRTGLRFRLCSRSEPGLRDSDCLCRLKEGKQWSAMSAGRAELRSGS